MELAVSAACSNARDRKAASWVEAQLIFCVRVAHCSIPRPRLLRVWDRVRSWRENSGTSRKIMQNSSARVGVNRPNRCISFSPVMTLWKQANQVTTLPNSTAALPPQANDSKVNVRPPR